MSKWLNRNIAAMGFTSLFSDFSHEMTTVVLPTFLTSLGGSPATLGFIEGVANASTSFMKFLAGWSSDIFKRRKPFAVLGYILTALGVGFLAIATRWQQVLFDRALAWAGKGLRKPPRDALLVESTQPAYYGRVFGFHRAMDTIGGVLGPASAFFLIKYVSLRTLFMIAFIPGVLSVIAMFLVKEAPFHFEDQKPFEGSRIGQLPRNFRIFCIAVAFYGIGKFADSMLILRATQLLTPGYGLLAASSTVILLYIIRNVMYASFSYPVGALADRVGKRHVLTVGYLLAAIASFGLMFPYASVLWLGAVFMLIGLSLAITDGLEKGVAADLIPLGIHGTGYGVLAALNGITAFVSSSLVGLLWTAVSPYAGFGLSAISCLLAACVVGLYVRRD